MLNVFLNHKENLHQIRTICKKLNDIKGCISSGDYLNEIITMNDVSQLFKEVREIAVSNTDECLANAQYVFREYFLFFLKLANYFHLLEERRYRESWDVLQDCLDIAKFINRYSDERYDLDAIVVHLKKYETLYPYRLFSSSEFIIKKSHCSICGKSMQSLECRHIKGNLYWGEPAIMCVDEIKELQAICLVKHPEDKRCVLEVQDDVDDEEKYKMLNTFLGYNLHFLDGFNISSTIQLKKKDVKAGRNDTCPCGSGIKYKKCCGRNLFYRNEHNIVSPTGRIKLFSL